MTAINLHSVIRSAVFNACQQEGLMLPRTKSDLYDVAAMALGFGSYDTAKAFRPVSASKRPQRPVIAAVIKQDVDACIADGTLFRLSGRYRVARGEA